MHRKLTILRDMGVNAIRSSHNPPAPELLNMCDSMGILVMDESFDMWRRKKSNGDYARFFDEWHQRDLSDLVKRDRNHPSIIMWSIGNEVLEQWSDAAADTLTLEQANLILNAGHDASSLAHSDELSVNSLLTQHLASIVKEHDPWGCRPVTAGCNEPDPKNHLFKSVPSTSSDSIIITSGSRMCRRISLTNRPSFQKVYLHCRHAVIT